MIIKCNNRISTPKVCWSSNTKNMKTGWLRKTQVIVDINTVNLCVQETASKITLNGRKCLKWIIHEMEMETWTDPEENGILIKTMRQIQLQVRDGKGSKFSGKSCQTEKFIMLFRTPRDMLSDTNKRDLVFCPHSIHG